MAVTVSTLSSVPRIRLNAGTSASGSAITKTMNLFSSSLLLKQFGTGGPDAIMAIAAALEGCLTKTINSVELVLTQGLVDE